MLLQCRKIFWKANCLS